MRHFFRRYMPVVLMILGAVMLARGLEHSFRQGLGWQGFIQASVAGALVFALGFMRWRYYLRQR
ncbi:MAG: hypothetical protein H6Q07_822 [Acidobacteria bacterium]|nr:hypothetical protein [Acidobacteriota bacterium]